MCGYAADGLAYDEDKPPPPPRDDEELAKELWRVWQLLIQCRITFEISADLHRASPCATHIEPRCAPRLMAFLRNQTRSGAYTVMAYIVMACIVMAHVAMAHIVMAYILLAYIVMAHIAMACIVMAHIGMAHTVMAIQLWPSSGTRPAAAPASWPSCRLGSTRNSSAFLVFRSGG